uniref:Uncharacterized protein n=1 Tax=Poecilia mexicana TaxID=48701 RepID=A0A3B3YIY9_9TELE
VITRSLMKEESSQLPEQTKRPRLNWVMTCCVGLLWFEYQLIMLIKFHSNNLFFFVLKLYYRAFDIACENTTLVHQQQEPYLTTRNNSETTPKAD